MTCRLVALRLQWPVIAITIEIALLSHCHCFIATHRKYRFTVNHRSISGFDGSMAGYVGDETMAALKKLAITILMMMAIRIKF